MSRAAFPALLGAAVVLASLAAGAAGPDPDPRERFGKAAARSVEAILGDWHPGSRVEWTLEAARLVTVEGEKRELRFAGFARRPVGDRHLVVTCIDFPEEAESRRRRVAAFERPALPSSRVVVAAAWTLADGQLDGAARRVEVAVPGDVGTCRTLHLDGVVEVGRWPSARIAYGSMFGGADWWGYIDWSASLDLASARLADALPVRATKTWRDGATAMRFVMPTTPETPRDERTRQLSANRLVLEVSCDTLPCATDGGALLEGIPKSSPR